MRRTPGPEGAYAAPAGVTFVDDAKDSWNVYRDGQLIGGLIYSRRDRDYDGYTADGYLMAAGQPNWRGLVNTMIEPAPAPVAVSWAVDDEQARAYLSHRPSEIIPDDVDLYGDPDGWEF